MGPIISFGKNDKKNPSGVEYIEVNIKKNQDYGIVTEFEKVQNGNVIKRYLHSPGYWLVSHSGEEPRKLPRDWYDEYEYLDGKSYRHIFEYSNMKEKWNDDSKIQHKEESEYLHNQLQKIDKNETELLSEVQEAIYRINPEERPKEKKGLMQTIFGSGSKIEALLVKLQDLSLETDPNNDFSLLTHTNGFHSSESSDS